MHEEPDLPSYDHIIVAFSGGKDSLACLLHLLELGVPRERIELWHHDVDGREGSSLMDWPCTRDYCRAIAQAFELPIYFSWKQGGFEREMLRSDAPTAPTVFETPEGQRIAGGAGRPGTRGQFPQVSPDLSVRWCSAYLKIDPCALAIRNQQRFAGRRTLVITGERAEESASRARYKPFEPHRADNREGKTPRPVDQWRPVHGWAEHEVWAIIERHRVNPHPCYRLGWGRCSCAACIFGSPDQWASLRAANPAQFGAVAAHEARSGKTIQRKLSVVQVADKGTPYPMDAEDIRAALSTSFEEPVILPPGAWKLPRGAFGDSCGPT
jgi:3'-phosphoadenosine 5'-phosphosulfate sulfotransferase (PAPS reductase)/FAD synthetase